MTILFTTTKDGYAAGSRVSTLPAVMEAAYVAGGYATYSQQVLDRFDPSSVAITGGAYLAASDGAVTFSGGVLTVPALKSASGQGALVSSPLQTFTPATPSRTVATITAGVVALSLAPQFLSKFNIATVNNSGSAVTGSVTITGNDERGATLSDTVTIASTANTATSNTVSNKYFASITSITPVSGTIANAGVVLTLTEYQFRGHLKVDASGVVGYAWNNTYAAGEIKLCTFEVVAAGILSVQDWRLLGPIPKAQRANEVVDFCGATLEGPPSWLGACIYTACEGMDGHIFIAGNGGIVSEFDGQTFIRTWRPTGLTGSDDISTIYCYGLNQNGSEIFYIGTYTGLFIRWDRTADTYSAIGGTTWTASKQVSKILKGPSNTSWAIGAAGLAFVITESGSSATKNSFTSNVGFSTGDFIYAGVWYDRHLYTGGGTGTGMKFYAYNGESVLGINLTSYLPGTGVQRGTGVSASIPAIYGMDVSPQGKILLAGVGSSFWLAEWDLNQQFAKGKLQFTTSAAASIPAGTIVSNGTNQFTTLEACSTTGAGTVVVPAIASLSGHAGLAAESTVTTLVSAVTNVTAVTNVNPFGMGRYIASGNSEDVPPGVVSNTPLAVVWVVSHWLILMQGGDVLSFDGSRLRRMTGQFSFKGRATGAFKASRNTWVFGDEGKLYALPH